MLRWTFWISLVLFGLRVPKVHADTIRGVSLGGWLLVEEWITPSLFRDTNAEDEWNLCNDLGKDQCSKRLDSHWSDFINRDDFEDMKTAGLNAIRIPIGYWAVDLRDDEPYVGGQYPYLVQAVQWAREVGLQVMIDLHGAPGSQNGQDNSGLIGPVLFASNTSNSDRSLDVLRNLTKEFSQSIYGGAVTSIELLNEPRLDNEDFTMSRLKEFYADDAFWGPSYWSTYDPFSNTSTSSATPMPTLILDTHQYYAFPPFANLSRPAILAHICVISQLVKNSSIQHPIVVGEFSLETNSSPDSEDDEGGERRAHAGPSQAQRTWYRLLFEAQAVAYSPSLSAAASEEPILGWYYWTWKTEWEIDTWSYRRGWRDGWIPKDVGNQSTFAFPVREDGCVDEEFGWEASEKVGAAAYDRAISGWWPFVVLGFSVAAGVGIV
ncbi:hypothetical protein MBLNU13_g00718t1 [Cladosporium sp. NU13]